MGTMLSRHRYDGVGGVTLCCISLKCVAVVNFLMRFFGDIWPVKYPIVTISVFSSVGTLCPALRRLFQRNRPA